MNPFRIACLSLFILALLCTNKLLAQARPDPVDSIRYRIVTDDGNVYQGHLIERTNDYVIMETSSVGQITIPFARIALMEKIGDGETERERANSTRFYSRPQETSYQITPNGYGLKAGEGYYQNYYLFLNQVYVGVTDYFTLGGGLIPIPTDGMPVWITPKFSFPVIKNKLNIGVGSLNGLSLMEDPASFGVFYGNITVGSRKRNFSLGAGKGYFDGSPGSVALSISGVIDVGEKAYLSTENYVFDGISMGLIGGRHIWPNISIDYGIIYLVEFDEFFAFPLAGITVPFGHKN